MKKKLSLFLAALTVLLSLTACGAASMDMGLMDAKEEMSIGYTSSSSQVSQKYNASADVMEKVEVEFETGAVEEGKSGETQAISGDKLVYTCNLSLQTLDYGTCVKSIRESIAEYGGFIEEESEYDDAYRWYYGDYVKTTGTKHLTLTVRVPSVKYYEFLEQMEGAGKVISRNSYVENISRQYYETDAYIKSLEIQQDRLLEMMEQAREIEDMITIEARLSEVQYQLNMAKTKLSGMDADVEYSTITIDVEEVMEYTPEHPVQKKNTFGDRLKNTLVDTWEFFWEMLEGILFLVIRLIPVALVVGVMAVLIIWIIKGCKKRKQRKLQKKADQKKGETN